MLFSYDIRKAQQLGAEWSASVIGRGQVDLKTHVSSIDFEIDDDAVIRDPRGFYRAVRDTVPYSSITYIGHGGENNNFEVV
jgi:hypothetical protein